MTRLELDLLEFMRFSKRLDPCCPNIYTPRWFESDWAGVTVQSLFWHEFEIKVSVSDYRADFKKGKPAPYDMQYTGPHKWYPAYTESKHTTLARMEAPGPNYFWFVVPDTIAEKIEPPKYAGLLIHKTVTKGRQMITIKKPAPRRHREKVSARFMSSMSRAIAIRYYRAIGHIRDLKEQTK